MTDQLPILFCALYLRIYTNTPIHIMVSISFSVWVIQYLQILLNSSGNFAYTMKFALKYYVRKRVIKLRPKILHVHKTGLLIPGHIYSCYSLTVMMSLTFNSLNHTSNLIIIIIIIIAISVHIYYWYCSIS